MCFVIVIEINPGSFCAACLDPLGPFLEFRILIIVPVPAVGAVQAQIDVVGCPDQLVRKSRAALGEIGHRLGRQVLGEVADVARPETILAWYRNLVAPVVVGESNPRTSI